MTKRETRNAVADYLADMCKRSKGNLEPRAVVDAARPKNSILHSQFEWDDSRAGELYRIDQARLLIRSCYVSFETKQEIFLAPCYIRNPSTTAGYTPVAALRTDKARAREALLAEMKLVNGALERARLVAHALGLDQDVERLLAGVVEVRTLIESS